MFLLPRQTHLLLDQPLDSGATFGSQGIYIGKRRDEVLTPPPTNLCAMRCVADGQGLLGHRLALRLSVIAAQRGVNVFLATLTI